MAGITEMNKQQIDSWWRAFKKKYHFDDDTKLVHQVSSWQLPDGRLVIRFGPRRVLVLPADQGDRSAWWTPVGPGQQVYNAPDSYDPAKRIVGAKPKPRPKKNGQKRQQPGKAAYVHYLCEAP
jgi:hypothetical protein